MSSVATSSSPRPGFGPVLVALGAMLWGTVGIASKTLYGIEDVPPLVVGFFRLALAVPLLAAWCWWRLGPATFHFPGRDLFRIATLGVAMALYQVFYFQAVALIGVALATLITICSAPVLVGAAAVILLGEPLSRRIVTALLIGLVGAGLLVGVPSDAGNPVGVLLALGSALSYAVFVLCSRSLAHHDPGKIIVVGFGAGALFLAPFALTAGVQFGTWPVSAWVALLYVGLVPTALAYLLYFRGMRDTPATPASILALAEPLTATVLAFALFDERLSLPAMIGAALLMVTMVILLRGPKSGQGTSKGN